MSTREQALREELAQLEAYAVSKHKAGDRHAVQDANSDMREIEARLDERKRTLSEVDGDGHQTKVVFSPDHMISYMPAMRVQSAVNPEPVSLDSFDSEESGIIGDPDGYVDRIR